MKGDQPNTSGDRDGDDSQQDGSDNDNQDNNHDDSIPDDPSSRDERIDLNHPPGLTAAGGGAGGNIVLNPFANDAKERMKESEERRQISNETRQHEQEKWERRLKTRLD